MIMTTKKKKPKFNVLNLGFFKSVKARWRRPRGTHNRKRMKQKWTGASPHIGYRNALAIRGVHPAGLREVLAHNVQELDGLKNVVVRIAGGVGARKRKAMEEKAKAMSLRILNSGSDGKAPSKHVPKAAKPAPAAKPQAQKPARKAAPPRAPEPPSPGIKR